MCTNIIIGYLTLTGDFHILWECLCVVFTIFWGTANQPGSLCNLREIARYTSVDKGIKNFNTGDEFLLHAFRAHLKAAVASSLTINTNSEVDHPPTEKWLYEKAEEVFNAPNTGVDLGILIWGGCKYNCVRSARKYSRPRPF